MENNKELNVICKECILLPKCIQRYKYCEKKYMEKYAFVRMIHNCSLIWSMCDENDIYDMYKKWWGDNYGK